MPLIVFSWSPFKNAEPGHKWSYYKILIYTNDFFPIFCLINMENAREMPFRCVRKQLTLSMFSGNSPSSCPTGISRVWFPLEGQEAVGTGISIPKPGSKEPTAPLWSRWNLPLAPHSGPLPSCPPYPLPVPSSFLLLFCRAGVSVELRVITHAIVISKHLKEVQFHWDFKTIVFFPCFVSELGWGGSQTALSSQSL